MAEPRIAVDEVGERASFDSIEVGRELGEYDWTVTADEIDRYSMAHTEFHEWYSVDSPFGGRVAPPSITYRFPRWKFAESYWVRGLFVGWENEQHDVIRPGVEYVWSGRISDKYVKRDREWVWHEWECRTLAGDLVVRTRRGHVLDYLTRSAERAAPDADAAGGSPDAEAQLYAPPTWDTNRSEGRDEPISAVVLASPGVAVGTQLTPVSHQYTWRYNRDWYDLLALPSHSQVMREFNIHTDPRAAAREGLTAPTTIGPLPASQISRMMLDFFGQGWLRGGRFQLRFTRQMALDAFLTAKGVVSGSQVEEHGTRLTCDVWVEDHRGQRTIVGSASGLVANG